MSSSFHVAETQWREQFTAMRKAIGELKIDPSNGDVEPYGEGVISDENDLTGGSDNDDLWDISSNVDYDDYSSDQFDGEDFENPGREKDSDHDLVWLVEKCKEVASRKEVLDEKDLLQQLSTMLASDVRDEELQMTLADMIGYDDLDFVIELISHRKEFTAFRSQDHQDSNGLPGRLQNKQERAETLRQADHEHKSAKLESAQRRGDEQYPHVYKVSGTGNTLSAFGRKYGLPQGSQRTEHDKYEETFVPAAQVGRLGAGRRLVEIAEMDGLCKRTFLGYQSLNRMQSLVYPVAYKTSENMLICAPTGAGKTDAAMLAILNAISHNIIPNPLEEPNASDFVVNVGGLQDYLRGSNESSCCRNHRKAGTASCMAGDPSPRIYW